ncbi:MAG: cobalamin transport system permease protein [Actinomycetota bacterium]|jgi:iron complex transport system permease protein|nr:cobalamin transport system permease protein [Actinomycetota bacterium]
MHPVRLRPRWVLVGVAVVVAAALLGLTVGPVPISPRGALLELVDRLPFVHVHTGLTVREEAIVWNLRLPRVVLGLQVGAMLSLAGASYQGAFRNPLADPYLLGAAGGAGLAVTLVIVAGVSTTGPALLDPIPLAAFAGALGAVALAYTVGSARGRGRSPAALVLAGVAVASFLTAGQTYVQQRNAQTILEVYTWILGRLTTAGWSDVLLIMPYFVVTTIVLLAHRRVLDVLSVGDQEASSLGLRAPQVRLIVVVAASLATAAAVSVSGLIAFVGIIVPHTVRLVAGTSYRVVLPLSVLFGAAFLTLADLLARTIISPAELPIGVITAAVGAPFFVVLLRTSKVTP